MKIFEKKVENVFYTACKYHEDWLISFENIAKRDRSFFVRPHSMCLKPIQGIVHAYFFDLGL